MMRNYYVWAVVVTVAVLVFSIGVYPHLNAKIPVHWNIRGEVDNYGSKVWAAFVGPLVMTAMMLVFRALPWLSPRRFEVDAFRPTYLFIMFVLVLMMGYLHVLMLWAGLGAGMDVRRAVIGGIMLFLAVLGNVLGRVERNFYIGVRTPWTLASEKVWYATHRVAAWTFACGGVLGFLLVMAGAWIIPAAVVVGVAVLAPAVYSLIYYKRLERSGEL